MSTHKKLINVGEKRNKKLRELVEKRLVKSSTQAINDAVDMYLKYHGTKTKVSAVYNLKGGVAKTTSVCHLAYGLAALGRKVLLIDFDPQGNASMMFQKFDLEKNSIYELIQRKCTLEETVVNVRENLDLIPSNLKLTFLNFLQVPAKEFMLKDLIEKIDGYDYILIDCPPEFGLFTMNALAVTDSIHVPVEPGKFAAEGLMILDEIVDISRNHLRNPDMRMASIFFTKVKNHTNIHKDVIGKVMEQYEEAEDIRIANAISMENAASKDKTIFEFDMRAKPVHGLVKFIAEFLKEEEGIDLVHEEIKETLRTVKK